MTDDFRCENCAVDCEVIYRTSINGVMGHFCDDCAHEKNKIVNPKFLIKAV